MKIFLYKIVFFLMLSSALPFCVAQEKVDFTNKLNPSVIQFTDDELRYISNAPVLKVAYRQSGKPVVYTNEDGSLSGIAPECVDLIAKKSGLKIKNVYMSNDDEINSCLLDGTYTAVATFTSKGGTVGKDIITSPELFKATMTLIIQKNTYTDTTIPLSYVLKKGFTTGAQYIHETSPKSRIIFLDKSEIEATLDEIISNHADATIMNSYTASYLLQKPKYAKLRIIPEVSFSQYLCLALNKNQNPLLLSILEKTIHSFQQDELQNIALANSAVMRYQYSFSDYFCAYHLLIIVTLLFLAAILFAMILFNRQHVKYTRKLQKTNVELQKANSAKSDFLSRMSHDIRTPLNGIIGMTYIARKQNNPEKTQDCLNKIDTSSKFLLTLINDILDVSKAESNKLELHPEPYTPAQFQGYLDAVIKPLCIEKNQKFVLDAKIMEGLIPKFDLLRVNQVVFNLLSNAVKYTPEGGTINCRYQFEKLPDPNRITVTLEVNDNGIGMSDEFQKHLFEPFTQEHHDDTNERRGSGLGLVIVKRIVELMDGTIIVQSKLGKGTTFTVKVQVAVVPESELAKQEPAKITGTNMEVLAGKHILLCEDHPLNQEITKSILEENKIIVVIAENGKCGVEAFNHSPLGYYDSILMDIRMPVMNGYEATKAIRALNRADAQTVPIIAMTADAFAEDVQHCFDVGMNSHVSKPMDPDKLFAELIHFCK